MDKTPEIACCTGQIIGERTIVVDADRLSRYARCLGDSGGSRVTILPGQQVSPFAAVNVDPFMTVPERLADARRAVLTSLVQWRLTGVTHCGDSIRLLTEVIEHGLQGRNERLVLQTVARGSNDTRLLAAKVTLVWKADPVSLRSLPSLPKQPGPQCIRRTDAQSFRIAVSPGLTATQALFEGRPFADQNPHVSVEAARRFGLPNLLVSAPHLSCLTADTVSRRWGTDWWVDGELVLQFHRPVPAETALSIELDDALAEAPHEMLCVSLRCKSVRDPAAPYVTGYARCYRAHGDEPK